MTADTRALLQAERASRRIQHPHAIYTSTNQLSCGLCQTAIKGEAQWQAHLKTAQHIARVEARKHAEEITLAPRAGQKRKADDEVDDTRAGSATGIKERKRVRGRLDRVLRQNVSGAEAQSLPIDNHGVVKDGENADVLTSADNDRGNGIGNRHEAAQLQVNEPAEQVNQAEWEAFEREIGELTADPSEDTAIPQPPSMRISAIEAINRGPTIVSKPVSAAELAAQAREELSTKAQRSKRDEELEQEREDAAEQAAEELDRMEQYDIRMKGWREKRDALRALQKAAQADGSKSDFIPAGRSEAAARRDADHESNDNDDSDDGEDDDWW